MRTSRVLVAASFLATFLELPKPEPYAMPLIVTVALKMKLDEKSKK